MVEIGFGKGQRFAGIAGVPLTKGIVPTFHMIRLTTAFADALMPVGWKDQLIGFPKITEGPTVLIGFRNLFPQFATGGFTPIPNHKGDNLPGAAAQRRP